MFTFLGSAQGFCDGLNRRNFLKIGAFGAGLTLADMLRLKAEASNNTNQAAASRPKSAIMIYLPGGPSHMDMYDLKPDAPAEFRGEFRPIQTNCTGVQICEHFPLQARMWDKFACIRSIVSVDEHSDSLVMTGKSQRENMTANHPCFGSVVSRVRSANQSSVPTFVSLRGMSRGTEPGFLGISHRPFSPNGPGVENLRPIQAVGAERQSDRRAMLESFDSLQREVDANAAGLDTFTTRAFDMITSGGVRNALDLQREPQQSRTRYQGVEQFLTARRLVEAGVGCVTMSYGGWDTHG
ncbi:MAG TPA: DUF1501 domain-containing protein, partial [Gemmataceae bacterium]|nr:DUF1501 domain-containing protein [Gemmataceae bacterium]